MRVQSCIRIQPSPFIFSRAIFETSFTIPEFTASYKNTYR